MRLRLNGLAVAAIAIWALALTAWVGLLAAERVLVSPSDCPLVEGSSDYGEASWSWYPPGVTCTWDLRPRGVDLVITREPPTARVGIALVLLLWGATLVAVTLRPGGAGTRGRGRRRRPATDENAPAAGERME
jgi:hypothetical protein